MLEHFGVMILWLPYQQHLNFEALAAITYFINFQLFLAHLDLELQALYPTL